MDRELARASMNELNAVWDRLAAQFDAMPKDMAYYDIRAAMLDARIETSKAASLLFDVVYPDYALVTA